MENFFVLSSLDVNLKIYLNVKSNFLSKKIMLRVNANETEIQNSVYRDRSAIFCMQQ